MANTTGKLYIRSKLGYRKPPKRLSNLPENENFVLMWYEGTSKKAKSVGHFADVAQTALINKEAELRRLALGVKSRSLEPVRSPEPAELGIAERDLAQAISLYLTEVKRGKAKKTHLAYSMGLS